jgi:hypothetical protein
MPKPPAPLSSRLHCWHRLENLLHPIAPFSEPREFVCCYCGGTEWSTVERETLPGHGDHLPPQFRHVLPGGPCRPYQRAKGPPRRYRTPTADPAGIQ